MEKQALAIVHVGIDFELPTRLSQRCTDTRGKGELKLLLNPQTAGFHQGLQSNLPLLIAGRFVGGCGSTKAERFLVHDDGNVLGEAFNQLPRFGKRCATLEGEMLAKTRQSEQFPQRPADPEILLHTDRLQAHSGFHLLAGQTALFRRESKKCIHIKWSFR